MHPEGASAESPKTELHAQHRPEPRVTIHVNNKPVHLVGHLQSGIEIKKAAIAQHVKIELDFLLYLIRHGEPNKLVADDDEVHVTDESRFHAIADDDNS
jgi:hypothetical protein